MYRTHRAPQVSQRNRSRSLPGIEARRRRFHRNGSYDDPPSSLLHHISRRDAVRVPGFHVLPMIIANSELLAVVRAAKDGILSHCGDQGFAATRFHSVIDLNVYWHERYHHDAPNQWFRQHSC